MLYTIVTGQAKNVLLLLWAIAAYAYFLPSILAFLKGHRGFFAILVLNILVSPLQSFFLHSFFPTLLVIDPHHLTRNIMFVFIANFGLGWLLLIGWAFKNTEPDARLIRAQHTKLYDGLVGLPLILWFAYGVLQLRPVLVNDATLIVQNKAVIYVWVQFFSLAAAAAFDLLLIYFLVIRDKPVLKSQGLLPRLTGFLGTFLGVGILQLPVAHLSFGLQILAAVLVGVGSFFSFVILSALGKSFSILPEARTLVTAGPYSYARHPLYGVEIITVIGTALQFAQPWSALLGLAVLVLLILRSIFEEEVLSKAYPEYRAYRARTARFIPGVI